MKEVGGIKENRKFYYNCKKLVISVNLEKFDIFSKFWKKKWKWISDSFDFNVSWCNGTKAITNGGRYRYWRKGFDCCLEIFDCDVSDSGDIVCVVEGINCTASDITVLHVNGMWYFLTGKWYLSIFGIYILWEFLLVDKWLGK